MISRLTPALLALLLAAGTAAFFPRPTAPEGSEVRGQKSEVRGQRSEVSQTGSPPGSAF